MSGPTVWRSVAASALPTTFKMPTISRAKRSTATPGWAGRLAHYGFPIGEKRLLYGTEPRPGMVAQRGGHKAGEPVSGVWGRFAAPSGR
ncbi:MAG: hypothetical protein M3R61_03865 [Chloroflexota bacterium]|nr:hypothetical protein [Chloroflexota bacterium]